MAGEGRREPVADFREQAISWPKGRTYEDFEVGMVFRHHWGRTLNEGDNSLFTTLTLHFNPLYFNEPYARAHGHPRVVVNPLLVFNTVFGMTVEDLSEGGGPFLGVDAMTHHRPRPCRRHGPCPFRGGGQTYLGEVSRLRHRHLAYQGSEPGR